MRIKKLFFSKKEQDVDGKLNGLVDIKEYRQ